MKHNLSTSSALTATKSQLIELLSRYEPLGSVKGEELCLRPRDALNLINDLEMLGVAIMGLDGWYYARPEHREQGCLAQDLAVDVYVGDEVLYGDNPVHDSARAITEYIKHSLPQRTEFVSLTIDVPSEWGLLLKQK